MLWVFLSIVVVGGMLTDTYIKKQKIDVKRLDKEIELEKLRLQNFEKETEKLCLELEQTKQLRLENIEKE